MTSDKPDPPDSTDGIDFLLIVRALGTMEWPIADALAQVPAESLMTDLFRARTAVELLLRFTHAIERRIAGK
jgi:hypothetical protein